MMPETESEASFPVILHVECDSTRCLPCRHLDNGCHDNVECKMVVNCLQYSADFTIDRLLLVCINVYG